MMLTNHERVIISRCDKEHIQAIKENFPNNVLEINDKARMIVIKKKNFTIKSSGGKIGLLTAGTSIFQLLRKPKLLLKKWVALFFQPMMWVLLGFTGCLSR